MKTRLFGFLVFLAVLIAWVVVCDSATIPGTIVAAKITAGDTGSTYSIGDTAEMQGTMKQVPDVATRDLISAARRTEGMFCYVTGETNLYALVGGVANANWMLWASGTNAVFTQTNISWTAITNVDQIQIPYAAITNAPAAFTQTNISWVDVTNLQSSQMPYTVITNAPWATTNYVNDATNAIYQAGTNYANSVTNGLSPLPPDAGGALTNNGAGVLGWYPGFASTNYVNDATNAIYQAGTNYANSATNAIYQAGTNYANSATNSIYVAGTNYANTVTNGLTPLPANAGGALTNDGAGVLGWDNGIARQAGTNTFSGNNVFSGSNFFSGAITGPTNSNNTTPDFSLTTGASLLVTNASFTFLTPINYDVTKKAQQWIEILVTNSTAADITITSPAGCATIGTAHCTNLTDVFVMYYPNVATNFYYIPCR